MAHLLISAAHKSSGKTVLTLGICAALRARGLDVQAFKKGPDYIDPIWLSKATQRACYNLDFWSQTEEEIKTLFTAHSRNADISIIEGNKGLHDGLATDGSTSNAALAKLLAAPVIMVLDTRGTIRGVAPLLLGYQQFEPAINIAGVILNFVGGSRHADKLKAVIRQYTDIPVLGIVPRTSELELVERYLGLMPVNEDPAAQEKLARIAAVTAEQIDLDRLLEISGAVPAFDVAEEKATPAQGNGLKIAYARDEAFGFYYADDLDAFTRYGVQLLPFDTLNDTRLPDADALFIGGGFPEQRLQQLAGNDRIKQAIHNAIEQGIPAYAECGGLMYLCNAITFESKRREMAGVIDAECEMFTRPIGRGYTLLQKTTRHPWPNVTDQPVAGHEFHYSKLSCITSRAKYAFDVRRGFGINGKKDGILHKNLLACYTHQRNTRKNRWVANFLDFIKTRSWRM